VENISRRPGMSVSLQEPRRTPDLDDDLADVLSGNI
jgi:hypothetical protein